MKAPNILPLALSLLLAVGCSYPGFCAGDFNRLEMGARDAFNSGDYKRADSQLHRLLERLDLALSRDGESRNLTVYFEATYKHLGECAMALENYDAASDYLKQAKTVMDSLHESDSELDADFARLSANHKEIDLNNIGNLGLVGPMVTAALDQFHPTKISISKTETGHHVTVYLADDVLKEIGNKAVTQVGVSKITSFDLSQADGGAVTLSNIVGVKVRAGFWVNIINASLKQDEWQHPIAIVTAQKMGISQSVTTAIPDILYMPVVALVGQVKNLYGPEGGQSQGITQALQQVTGAIAQQRSGNGPQPGAEQQPGINQQTGMTPQPTVFPQQGLPAQQDASAQPSIYAQPGPYQQQSFSQQQATLQQQAQSQEPGATPPAVAAPLLPISPLDRSQPGETAPGAGYNQTSQANSPTGTDSPATAGYAPVTNSNNDAQAPVIPIPPARPDNQQQGN